MSEEPLATDWAYAAGFVDGEGCIAIVRSLVPARGRYYYGVHVVVSNTDRVVLDWMQTVWGGWVVATSAQVGRARASWNWRISGRLCEPFLVGIKPWLRLKGAQCQNALAMIELMKRGHRTLGRARLPQSWLDEQEKHYWVQRELNHRGSDLFVARPMHSPRQISRARAIAANIGI